MCSFCTFWSFYISYPCTSLPPSTFPPLTFLPRPFGHLPFILCRSTLDNLCGHSWAQCLPSVCLSSYSLTAGFWRSYCFVPTQISWVQNLCLSTVNTVRARCLLQEKSAWHRQLKDNHKARQTPPGFILDFFSLLNLVCGSFFPSVLKFEN